ncbi:hypothetical protein GCM10022409_43150 [Hymenobacter glaciei]|uniref:PA14 domain-containing protein n=1 Tax=Hymenobacter glaciei TaxID=877209 RepID=A0ABP7USQ2_9BACT
MLVASLFVATFPAQAQTFKAIPLDCGGWFSGFAQADNGRLYGYGDVFGAWRSDDGGTSWRYLNWGIPGGDIYGTGMAVQKDNPDVVYYGASNALSKSTNGGDSWTRVLEMGDDAPRFRGSSPILIRSNNPNEIWFAGSRKGQTGWLWKSSNGGTDWVKAGGSAFDNNRTRTLHNVAAFPNQIWVGSDNGLYVSTDGGTNFSLVGGSGRLTNVGMIARFTTGSFAGVGLVTRSDGGYAGGISRITATNYNDASTYSVSNAATGNFFLGYPSGLQIFSDGSSSAWNTAADIHAFSPAGNGGQTFTKRATTVNTSVVPIWATAAGLAARNTPDYGTDQVIEAVGNPNKWLITGGGAPMYSLDKGLSWQYFPNGNGLAAAKTYWANPSRFDANRVYVPAGDIGSVTITDGGSSGQATQSSFKSYYGLHSTFRVLEGPDTQNLVLAGVDQSNSATVILKTANGGSSWNTLSQTGNGLPRSLDGITKSVMSLTDANDFLVVLASGTANSGPIPPGSINPGVWRTTNGGTTFNQVADLPTTGLQTGHRYDPQSCFIERDAVQANVRYFVSRSTPFYRSTNGGTNWTARTHPYNQQAWAWDLHADPVRGENIWAAGDYAGVKVSRDGGQSWTPTAKYLNARVLASYDGKIAVFGKASGDAEPLLYYSEDDGATFRALTTPARNFHGVQGLAVDRNGKVWVSWNSVTVVNPNPVTSVAVTPNTATLAVGATRTLSASVAPSTANQAVTWTSSAPGIATVTSGGLVTGVSAGSATITATSAADNTTTQTATITVTGAATAYPIITSRGENLPNEGKAQAFDLNNGTKWLDFNATSYLQIQYQNAAAFNQYVLVSGNDSPERDPTTWTVQGSNDGSKWTVLDSQSGQSWPSRNLPRSFGFANSTAYSYYKLDITANGGGNIIQLAEVTFGTLSRSVTLETWSNVGGTTLAAIPTTAATSTATLTSLESPTNSSDNYGLRMRGYIVPSTTGAYTFYIASDDNGEFCLSADSQPTTAPICSVGDWTNSKQWDKYGSQRSAPQTLVAGRKYYFRALMKEGGGGDNLAIGWTGPGFPAITVIGAANLDQYVPTGAAGRPGLGEGAAAEQSSAVHVYPNPAAGSFRVSTGSADGAKITVTTMDGRVIRRVQATGPVTNIESGTWQPGLYLVRVQTGATTTVKKLVIAN